jgi:hypothetical protein
MILSGSVKNTYPSGHGGGGGGSEMVGDVSVGNVSAEAADGGAEDGPEVVVGARVVLGAGAGGVGGEEMALGADTGAEWSGMLTGTIFFNCGGSARRSESSAIGDSVGVALGGGGERAGGGVRRGGGT